ncbi:MAG: metallophosphoesterase [Bacilli bacterium]|nr:metallophosphoesterase [Bacilli bacterium]
MNKKEKETKETKENKSHIFIYILLIIGLIIIYSRYIATTGIQIKEYSVINNKIPESFKGFKVVHFSDLKYGSTTDQKYLKKLVNKINELNPDIIIFTGDLISSNYKLTDNDKKSIIENLNKLDPKIDIYSIRGDNDINETYNSIITQTKIIEINNLNKLIYYKGDTPIMLIGLDDSINGNQSLDMAFNYEENNYYKILITHEPDTYEKIKDKNIDLFLAGHSLNGQVRLPFIGSIYTPTGAKKYYDSKYKIDNTEIYISNGLGTSKIPYRLNNRPSINLYRFYNN